MKGAIASFATRYRSAGAMGAPLTPDKVADLERHLGLPLPAAYQAYLLLTGAEPPPVLVGSDCHGERLFELRDWAIELLEESDRPFELPADAVVFHMHQGYQFFYFMADGVSDDPAVWYYLEGRPAAELRFKRFSDWVTACVASR